MGISKVLFSFFAFSYISPHCHAAEISPFTHISPGTMFELQSLSVCKHLSSPFEAAATTPVGPYMLSIHPWRGSLYVETTIAGRYMASGIEEASCRIISSATAFV